ncbi:MAG: polysaccharide biosynthesis C-terminal domain-containing protein, partial [Bacteroidota bacterium]|nr:polysaccharide biosynthesis C-terminal domain-containing protein [Bacteroidota bacterium]
MNLLKTTFFSGIFTAIRVLTGMVSIKIVAVYLGPTGVAFVGQFQSFLKIVNNASNLGIGQGIIKYIAEFKENENEYPKIISTSIVITTVVTTIISILVLVFSSWLGEYMFKTNEYNFVFIVLALVLVFYSFGQIIATVLNGFKEIRKLLTARIIGTLLGLGFTVTLVLMFNIKGALIALVLSQTLLFFILFLFARKSKWFKIVNFVKGVDKKFLRLL